MHPAFSILFLTTLIGAGQGLVVVLALGVLVGVPMAPGFVSGALLLALALLLAGLGASFLHLGHKLRAWRAVLMWRTSWMSREVIVLPAFIALVALWWWVLRWGGPPPGPWLLPLLLLLGAGALWWCTAMIYACLRFVEEWAHPLTVVNFLALGCASGLTAAAALAAWLHPPLASSYVAAALLVGAFAYLARLAALARNARLRPKSTLATAIGVKHPKIVQIAQGAMGGSFNTREFFHGRPREMVRAVRWSFLVLVPGPLLGVWAMRRLSASDAAVPAPLPSAQPAFVSPFF